MSLNEVFEKENNSLNKRHALEKNTTGFFQDLFRENYIYFRVNAKQKNIEQLRKYAKSYGVERIKNFIPREMNDSSVDRQAYHDCKNLFKQLAGNEIGHSSLYFDDYLIENDLDKNSENGKHIVYLGWGEFYKDDFENDILISNPTTLDLIKRYKNILDKFDKTWNQFRTDSYLQEDRIKK